MLKIPLKFTLLGYTIDVSKDQELEYNSAVGAARFSKDQIALLDTTERRHVTRTAVEHAFLHELVHWILYLLNQGKLNEDETFVDQFAGLLHQAITTAKGELKLNAK